MDHSWSTAGYRLFGVAMIAAPVLLLASTVAYAMGSGFNDDQVGGTIQIYAMAIWFLAMVGFARMLEGPFPRAAVALLVVGAIGVSGGVAYGLDSIHVAEGAVSAEEAGAAGVLALNIPGAMSPLALVGCGVALARAYVEPRWAGLVLVVAAILFPASRIPAVESLALVADALFVIAVVPLGWSLLRGRDPAAATEPAVGRTALPAPPS